MTRIVLLTGGNLGPVRTTLEIARKLLVERIGPELAHSKIYSSAPWGFESRDQFLNQVVVLESVLSPFELLNTTQQIEKELGRKRDKERQDEKGERGYQSRTIDIDTLFYGDEIINSQRLTVPHPLIGMREFVLEPLNEVLAEYIHPTTGHSIGEMLRSLKEGAIK